MKIRALSYNHDTHTIADIAPRGAAAYGDAPALGMVGGESLGYRELELQTRRAAAGLLASGVARGDRVAILSENRAEWGVASLAIARAGAVAVPLLVDFPAAQVAEILAHSGAKAAFVSARQATKLAGVAIEAIPMEGLCSMDAELDGRARDVALPSVAPDDLAAIVYTSGTTGQPKGVMLTHRNYIADALSCSVIIELSTRDTLLSILPLAHAYEYTIGFLIPMMSGASVRYLDRPPSASALMPALASVRPTIVLSVPLVIEKTYRQAVKPALERMAAYRNPLLRPLVTRLAGAKLYRSFGGRLRFFGVGGAPLDPEVEAFLRAVRWPYAIGYGLTETAPIIAASAVGRTSPRAAGPALPGAEIRLTDMRPADDDPSMLVGEIQVRGPMVGPGYYRDESRTREAFTPDGYFRTGDLGFRDERGYFFVRGRSKNMILGSAGENIYPEEVEAVLARSPAVQEALVYGGAEGLVALVHLKPEAVAEAVARVKASVESAEKAIEKAVADTLEAIRREANQRLAAFSRICRVVYQPESFEKTPTQKIKRFLYPKNPEGGAPLGA